MKSAVAIRSRRGFTLVEVLLASTMLGLVMAGSLSLYLMVQRTWHATSLRMYVSTQASQTLARMINGIGVNLGLRAGRAESSSVTTSGQDWELVLVQPGPGGNDVTNRFEYVAMDKAIYFQAHNANQPIVIGRNVIASTAAMNYDAVQLMVRVAETRGRFSATNEVNTRVKFRN